MQLNHRGKRRAGWVNKIVSEMKRGGGGESPGKSRQNEVNVNTEGNKLQRSGVDLWDHAGQKLYTASPGSPSHTLAVTLQTFLHFALHGRRRVQGLLSEPSKQIND